MIVTFQSRFGREEWLKPYTVEEVARLARAGRRNIAIMAPVFSADCVETLEEINGEIREAFLHAGGETFSYIPCLNAERGAHRHADGDRRARARRLALTPAQRSSGPGARRSTSAVAAMRGDERRDRTAAVDLLAVADDGLAVRQGFDEISLNGYAAREPGSSGTWRFTLRCLGFREPRLVTLLKG